MFRSFISALTCVLLLGLSSTSFAATQVILETNQGQIELELNDDKAPITVANFLSYVDDGFYDGTIFHRVMAGFMIQGGGFTPEMDQKDTDEPIRNESDNGLPNKTGTIAMARTRDPHSATAQFFINTVNNSFLNNRPGRPGYAVFGKVTKGMDVVLKISRVPTTSHFQHQNVPKDPIIIVRAYRAAH